MVLSCSIIDIILQPYNINRSFESLRHLPLQPPFFEPRPAESQEESSSADSSGESEEGVVSQGAADRNLTFHI